MCAATNCLCKGCDESSVNGIAHNGYICNKNHRGYAMALDNGKFGGVLTATHELAHLIGGVRHDGNQNDSFAKHCQAGHGFIMTDIMYEPRMHQRNSFKWSTCS